MTDCEEVSAAVMATLGSRWLCTPLSDGRILIAAPLTYHDGDHPEMIVAIGEGGVGHLSDFGSTSARLGLRDATLSSDRLRRPAGTIAKGFGLSLTGDDELVQEGMTSNLGEAIVSMASAMLQIDALGLVAQPKAQPRFATRVGKWLQRSLDLHVDTEHSVRGNHGKKHRVTAAVDTGNRLVYVQAVGRAAAEARPIEHTFRVFYEVNGSVGTDQKVVVLQDPVEKYDGPDIDLLRDVAYVGSWEQKDNVLDYLRQPAPVPGGLLYSLSEPPLS